MNDRWSKTIIALHWISAALLVGLVVVGFVMVDLPAEAPLRRVMGRMHSLGGLTLGILTLVRFLVRMMGKSPAPISLPALHRKGVSFVHGLLYVALFGMGASGVGTALGSSWPAYVSGDAASAPVLEALLSRQVHGALVFGLLLLVGAHVVGVLVQQLKQGGVLRRMLPFLR
jgi:cytochrome b561